MSPRTVGVSGTARAQWRSDIKCVRQFARDAKLKLRDELAAAKPSLVPTSLRIVEADAKARAFETAVEALKANYLRGRHES